MGIPAEFFDLVFLEVSFGDLFFDVFGDVFLSGVSHIIFIGAINKVDVMKRYHCYSANFDLETEVLFKEAVFLGQGNNGVVYMLPKNKVIKLFFDEKVWYDEASILSKAKDSKYFPRLYSKGNLYIVREMIEGVQLDKYIKKYGLNKQITRNIYNITKEFKRLKFTKIDSRCKDLYVGKDSMVRIIDPKKYLKRKVSFPRHLMKGLMKLKVLEDFLNYMKEIDMDKALEWETKFNKYWEKEKLKKSITKRK